MKVLIKMANLVPSYPGYNPPKQAPDSRQINSGAHAANASASANLLKTKLQRLKPQS